MASLFLIPFSLFSFPLFSSLFYVFSSSPSLPILFPFPFLHFPFLTVTSDWGRRLHPTHDAARGVSTGVTGSAFDDGLAGLGLGGSQRFDPDVMWRGVK